MSWRRDTEGDGLRQQILEHCRVVTRRWYTEEDPPPPAEGSLVARLERGDAVIVRGAVLPAGVSASADAQPYGTFFRLNEDDSLHEVFPIGGARRRRAEWVKV